MLLAGLSETVLISGLLFAYRTLPAHDSQLIRVLFNLSLLITGTAAIFGFIRYTGLWENISLHQNCSFFAKHIAMTFFINLSAWGIYQAQYKLLAKTLLSLSVISFTINLAYPLTILSDAIIIVSLILLMTRIWTNIRARVFVALAITLLLSTLIWGLLLSDANLKLALFHVSLAGFFIALSLALAKPSQYFSNALE